MYFQRFKYIIPTEFYLTIEEEAVATPNDEMDDETGALDTEIPISDDEKGATDNTEGDNEDVLDAGDEFQDDDIEEFQEDDIDEMIETFSVEYKDYDYDEAYSDEDW